MDNDTRDAEHVELTWMIDGSVEEVEIFTDAKEAEAWASEVKAVYHALCPKSRNVAEEVFVTSSPDDTLWQIFATSHGAHAIGADCDCVQFETTHAPIWSNGTVRE